MERLRSVDGRVSFADRVSGIFPSPTGTIRLLVFP